MGRTSGVPIPMSVILKGKRFRLREFVIRMALEAEDRALTQLEEKEVLNVARSLRQEYPNCWDHQNTSTRCHGILRAARMLLSLLEKDQKRPSQREVEDLIRWLEYGKRL